MDNQTLKALVVDDSEPSAKTMGWMIDMLGAVAETALSGREALERAPVLRPDILLLDIGLPDMNGYELCRKLRQLPELAQSVFIAQTGWSGEEHRQAAQEAGFHHYLLKPVDLEKLKHIIEAVRAQRGS